MVLGLAPAVLAETPLGGPHLTLDGAPLDLAPAPLRMAGEVFAPLNALGAAVGAQVEYTPGQTLIRLTRGATRVTLWLGQKLIMVADQAPQTIAAAPFLVGDAPYLPLSPVMQAWGIQYSWDPATETAALTTGQAAELRQVSGELVQIYAGPPPAFLVQGSVEQGTQVFVAAPNLVYARGKVGAGAQAGTLADLRLGDQVDLGLDAQGHVARLLASYAEKTGRLQGVAENRLILTDGTLLPLAAGARVVTPEGAEVDLTAVPQNAALTVRYNPVTNRAWEIVTAAPTAQTTAVRILSVGLVDYVRPLHGGEALKVEILGTAGGTATFQVGEAFLNLPAPEGDAGHYLGQFIVPTTANAKDVSVKAFLQKGGVAADPLVAEQPVTLDNTPPAVGHLLPAAGSTTKNQRPVIGADFTDEGSGPDPASVVISLDGAVLAEPTVTPRKAAVVAPPLTPGQHQVEFTIKDQAAITRTVRWSFNYTPDAGQVLLSVAHNGLRPLNEEDTLVVEALAKSELANPVVDLGTWKTGLAMTRVPEAEGFLYRLTYDVVPGDRVDGATVMVRGTGAGAPVQLAAAYPLTLAASEAPLPQELTVLQPAEGALVANNLVVSGLGPAHSVVRLTVTYSANVLFGISGQVSQQSILIAEDGTWASAALNLRLPLIGMADKYKIVAELLDAEANVVQTKTINVKGK